MAKTIRLTESDLSLIVRRVIKEQNEATISNYKRIFVDSGKLSEEVFDEIVEVSKGKGAYVKWLAARVAEKKIKDEDIYKFEGYIDSFEKAKRSPRGKAMFPIIDINQVKSSSDVREFIDAAIQFEEIGSVEGEEEEMDSDSVLISKTDILKLQDVGINLIGLVAGYQIFKVSNINKETWEVYRTILGKCKEGASIHICTIAGYSHFKNYLEKHPGSSYYVIFNQNDPLSPYQFHYESNQFKDRKDADVF
jgi:hypothetical protein